MEAGNKKELTISSDKLLNSLLQELEDFQVEGTVIKPLYRQIALMRAQGVEDVKIAEVLETTEGMIQKVTTREWWPNLYGEAMSLLGKKSNTPDVLEAYEADVYRTYYTLMMDGKTPAATRKACGDAILDRLHGKPKVAEPKDNGVQSFDDVDLEASRLRQERERTLAELKRLGYTSN